MSAPGRVIVQVAEDLDVLIDALAEYLRLPIVLDDPFATETIVYPNTGVRDYITSGLADRLGIAANIEFQSLGSFVTSVLAGSQSDSETSGATEDWSIANLTWVIHEVLLDVRAGVIVGLDVPGLPNATDHSADGVARSYRGESLWAIARRIADLFDRYAFHRPTLIESWAGLREEDPSERSLLQSSHEWQPKLWRIVDDRIRSLHSEALNPAQVRRRGLSALREGHLPETLPHRVLIVGMSAIPPSVHEVLSALATQLEVRVFMTHPSKTWWDSTPAKQALDSVFDDSTVDASIDHPLLRSWGQTSLASSALVKGRSDVDCEWLSSPAHNFSGSPDLLGHLREGLSRGTLQVVPDLVADDSLQLHACHGASRQVEVLREALLRTFVEFDGVERLEARDVLIVCPDIERFAPLVEAIFGRGSNPIGAVLSDRAISSENHIVSALMAILDVATGRATVGDLVSLIGMDPIRIRFGWSTEEVEDLSELCVALGVRWGLNKERRGGPSGLEDGSWRWVADQMLLGIADDAPMRRRRFAEVPPADGVSSTAISMVGSFGVLVSRLEELNEWIFSSFGGNPRATAKPAEQWHGKLRATLVDLLADMKGASFGHAKLLARFDGLWGRAATSGVELTLEDVRSMLATLPDSSPGRLRLRSGKVTVSSMLPSAGVPADVVCILGFDEAASRSPGTDGDDILGHDPRIGDRNGRNESRQLILEAVRSARRRLIITYDGFDVSSNEEVKPVVALQEFLDVVETILPDVAVSGPTGGSARFVSKSKRFGIKHPRHGFDERYFSIGGVDGRARVFSHDRSARDTAIAARGASGTRDTTNWRLSVGSDSTEFTIDELAEAITNPARVYLRDRLEISLPEEQELLEDSIPTEIPSLVEASLGRELLDVLLGKSAGSRVSWRDSAALHPECPPAAIGIKALDQLEESVEAFKQEIDSLGGIPAEPLDGLSIAITGVSAVDADDNDSFPNDDSVGVRNTGGFATGLPLAPDDALPVTTPRSAVDCVAQTIVGSIENLMIDGKTLRLVVARYARPKSSVLLATAVRLAALVVDGRWRSNYESVEGVVVSRAEKGDGVREVRLYPVRENSVAKAQAFLDVVCNLRCNALQDAVPFFDELSRKIHAKLKSVDCSDSARVREGLEGIGIKALLEKDLKYDRYRRRHWLISDVQSEVSEENSETVWWAMRIWNSYFDFIEEVEAKSDSSAGTSSNEVNS